MVQNRPFRDTQLVSKKKTWNPYFYSVLGFRLSGPRCQKREIWKATKKRKNLTDNWKAIFWCFCCCFFGLLFFLFFLVLLFVFFVFFFFWCFLLEGLRVRWGGPKGHLTWPLNPPYFFCFVFAFLFFVLFLFFFLFWRFKGQVRWPKGPPHLALNPPYLFFLFFCFVLCFVFFGCLIQNQKPCFFPPEKGFFIYFQCFSFFLPLPFWASLFFCFSFSVSLFSSFLSFFLLVFVLAFFWFLVFVSFFFFLSFSFFFAFLSWKEQHQNIQLQVFLACHPFSFLSFLFFLFQVPFCYLSSFLILSYVFCSTSRFLVSKQRT